MDTHVQVYRSRFPRQDQPSARSILMPLAAERGFLLLSTSGHRQTRAREITFGRAPRASLPVNGRLQGAVRTQSGVLCALVEDVLHTLGEDLSWGAPARFPGATSVVASGEHVLVGRPTEARTVEVAPQTMQTLAEYPVPIPDLVLDDGRWLRTATGVLSAAGAAGTDDALRLPAMRGAVARGAFIAAASLPRVDPRTKMAQASAALLWINAATGETTEQSATADHVLGFDASGLAVAVTLDPALREYPRVVRYGAAGLERSAAMRKAALWWGLHAEGVLVGFDESSQKTDRMVVVQWAGERLGAPEVADARITPEKKA